MRLKRRALLILILTVLSISAHTKTLTKVELLEDFSSQYITIISGDKTYCIEATQAEFIPIDNIQDCQQITDVTIMLKGSVCIEEDDEIVCRKVRRKTSGVFWGSENKINFSQSLDELKGKINKIGSNKTGKKYYKKAKKYYKKKQYLKAYEWTKKSADLGNKNAYFGLGLFFQKGHGIVDKDQIKAIKWYRRAAVKGHVRAKVRLATLLRDDNPDEAIEWLKKAAEQGNATAMNNIGYMWSKGRMSTFGNNKKAYKWYTKSAELGDKVGQYNVCRSLMYRLGTSRNLEEAQKWCQRSADQGYKPAKRLIDKFEGL